ncbi:MAG: hypothetical protein AAF462_05515 [Thermodesulfobacteriota bacterium]
MGNHYIHTTILFTLFVLLCLTVFGGYASLAQDEAEQEYIAEVRPGDENEKFPINVGVVVIDIDSIDGAQQSFVANFAVVTEWNDPRLVEDIEYYRVMDTDDVWTPNLQILNQQKLFTTFRDEVTVLPNGNVYFTQRYWGTLSYPMNLKDFPLDEHSLKIKLVAVGKDSDNITFNINPERTDMSEILTVTDWEIRSWDAYTEEIEIGPKLPTFPGVVFEFEAKRLVKFYLIKVLLPLMLIVLMSLVVLFIDPNHTGPKLSIAITAILTLIAYRFLLGNLLPKISYLTHMDYFIFGSMFLVFAVLVETSIVARYMSQKREQEANNLDYWSRWVFVIAFLLVTFGSFIL